LYKKIGPDLAQILNNEARNNCLADRHDQIEYQDRDQVDAPPSIVPVEGRDRFE
jgi:hypothetical protein